MNTPNDPLPLDPERLLELQDSLGVEAGELKTLVLDRFIKTVTEGFPLLDSLLVAQDAPGFRLKSHQLKGSSLNAGAMPLAQVFMSLEEMGKTGDLTQAPSGVALALTEFRRLKNYLSSGEFPPQP
ncbi:MAG: Hpt domain-containing protein [Elusimicrobia bacterium]|nr:Hpt domain-containing protein [Elusimicrobiota bacterium]